MKNRIYFGSFFYSFIEEDRKKIDCLKYAKYTAGTTLYKLNKLKGYTNIKYLHY